MSTLKTNHLLDKFNKTSITTKPKEPVTRIKKNNTTMSDAKKLPPIKKLFGDFWHSGEIAILAGDTGIGKSILAVHMQDLNASSAKYFIGQESETQEKVLYYDFELSEKQFEKRFLGYVFSDDAYRLDINPTSIDATFSIEDIHRDLKKTGAKLIIVDNITALSMKNTADPEAAMNIMRELKKLQLEKGVSSLVLAHVPKIPVGTSLNINHLAGSKHLANFADSVFFIARSSQQPSYRYLKQVKARSSELDSSVLVCDLVKKNDYLTFDFISYDDEANHLAFEKSKSDEKEEEKIRVWDLSLQVKNQRELAKRTGFALGKVNRLLKTKPRDYSSQSSVHVHAVHVHEQDEHVNSEHVKPTTSVHVHSKHEHVNMMNSEQIRELAKMVLADYESRGKPKIIQAIKHVKDVDDSKAEVLFNSMLEHSLISHLNNGEYAFNNSINL